MEHAVEIAYLSLGSNLGDAVSNINRALAMLSGSGMRIVRRSSMYHTAPLDCPDQPWFVNMAAEVETQLTPEQLLERTQAVENNLGRTRLVPKGPRTIDIDIILYGSRIVDRPGLQVPHPAMHLRRFVLEPLAEIVPDLLHPIIHRSVRELLMDVGTQTLSRLN